MSRFSELSDEELQLKAEQLGIADAATLTRDQLEARILEAEPEATDESVTEEVKGNASMAERGDFVTPLPDQGSEPAGADEELREPVDGQTEVPPSEDEPADESSAGGTGGTTVGTTGNVNG